MTIGIFTFAQTSKEKKIGVEIEGDFLGNGKKITATAIKIKEEKGNPIEDGTPAEYEIRFSDKKIKTDKSWLLRNNSYQRRRPEQRWKRRHFCLSGTDEWLHLHHDKLFF